MTCASDVGIMFVGVNVIRFCAHAFNQRRRHIHRFRLGGERGTQAVNRATKKIKFGVFRARSLAPGQRMPADEADAGW